MGDCSFGDGVGQVIECLPIGGSSRLELEWKKLWIEGDVISGDEYGSSICDDASENLVVSGDADEDTLFGGQTERLILKLATICVDRTKCSNGWDSANVSSALK